MDSRKKAMNVTISADWLVFAGAIVALIAAKRLAQGAYYRDLDHRLEAKRLEKKMGANAMHFSSSPILAARMLMPYLSEAAVDFRRTYADTGFEASRDESSSPTSRGV